MFRNALGKMISMSNQNLVAFNYPRHILYQIPQNGPPIEIIFDKEKKTLNFLIKEKQDDPPQTRKFKDDEHKSAPYLQNNTVDVSSLHYK